MSGSPSPSSACRLCPSEQRLLCSGSTNSDWSIDHDDASSFFEDSQNVMVYGSHKWRDGVHKHYFENLYVIPEDATPNAEWGIGWYVVSSEALLSAVLQTVNTTLPTALRTRTARASATTPW